MNQRHAQKLEEFFCSLSDAQSSLLLLDYDGTLADFCVNRFDAKPWAGVRELLSAIQQDKRTRLIVITGRPADEINTMLQLPEPVEVWGLHGAERVLIDGRRELEVALPEAQAKLEELRQLLKDDAFGGLFEDKPNAAVMHWRGHPAEERKAIERKTRDLFESAAKIPGLSLLNFECGVELRVGRDKGGAVEAIIEEYDSESQVAYLGDDLTDESAFCALKRSRNPHLSVLMRRTWRETAAEVWLQPPDELLWFLKEWNKAVRGSAGLEWEATLCRKASHPV